MFSSISCLFTPTSPASTFHLRGQIFPCFWPGSSGSPWGCRSGSGSLCPCCPGVFPSRICPSHRTQPQPLPWTPGLFTELPSVPLGILMGFSDWAYLSLPLSPLLLSPGPLPKAFLSQFMATRASSCSGQKLESSCLPVLHTLSQVSESPLGSTFEVYPEFHMSHTSISSPCSLYYGLPPMSLVHFSIHSLTRVILLKYELDPVTPLLKTLDFPSLPSKNLKFWPSPIAACPSPT